MARTLAAFLHGVGSTVPGVERAVLGPANLQFESREDRNMNKTLLLVVLLLAMAFPAAAQENLNFTNLPLVSAPTPMPDGYGQLNWTNIFYVDPYLWGGSGPGYKDGPVGEDVTFVGGKVCRVLQESVLKMRYVAGIVLFDNGPLVE